MGRIHCLLLQFGRELVSVLSEVVPQLRVACQQKRVEGEMHDWKMIDDIVSPSFVVETTKKNQDSKNTSSAVSSSTTTSQEWNDLMTQYLEVSQDSITKQMNEFVKRKRLDNARLRFGVGPDMKKKVSNDNQEDDEQTANDDEMQLPSINDTSDMGELVSMHKSDDSSLAQIKSSERIDPNMARIRQHRESTKSTSVTDSSSSKKKKRRKKKKKEQSEPKVDGTDIDDFVGGNTNEEQSPQHEHLDKAAETTTTASDLLDTTLDDNSSDGIEVKKGKKSKKKDKKSKKRKKASSVIDDIFG